MKKLGLALVLLIVLLPGLSVGAQSGGDTFLFLPLVTRPGEVQAPTLKWSFGGCYSSWCETGWYSSPAVINLDGDPQAEIIASGGSLAALDGETGALQWRDAASGSRTWPGIVLADLEGDGPVEVVIAQGGGWVRVYRLDGSLKWTARPTTSELRGLLAADLDNDGGSLDLVVTAAIGSRTSVWVLDSGGNIRPGWPQISGSTPGYSYGIFNANAAAADLIPGGALEIVVPSDTHYISAYTPAGIPLPANAQDYPGKVWGSTGVWEDISVEKRGWGECESGYPRSENHRPNFAHSPASIADLNGDGSLEVVAAGNVHDCSYSPYLDRYLGPFIFNADRSRFQSSGFDWRSTPVDTGAPLSQDWRVIENAQPNPALADLDGDGVMEILYASYDGRLHAFWLDKTEHGSWPLAVYDPADGFYTFASEPAVADLNNDGSAEVIFTTWVAKGSEQTGQLIIASALGEVLHEVDLPQARSDDWNGSLPAPTLANVDQDPDLEVVLNTAASGVVVFDLPGTANARLLWFTGRGNYLRSGTP